MAKPGFTIQQILINEVGDYTLVGAAGGAAQAQVAAAVFVEVIEVDANFDGIGEPITPVQLNTNLVFSPDGGLYVRPADDGTSVLWTGNRTIDVDQLLADNSVSAGAFKVKLTMDNTLSVFADELSSAFIQKEDVDITIIVPEPSSVLLLVMGLAVVVGAAVRFGHRRA